MRHALALSLALALAPTSPAAEPDALAEMNGRFRSIYARVNKITIDKAMPIILSEGDEVVLLRGGKREAVNVVPKRYHELKSVAHVPLALVVLFEALGTGLPLAGDDRADLEALRDKVAAARPAVAALGLDPECLKRQSRILDESVALLSAALERGTPPAAEVQAFARAMKPLVLANAREAARAEIDATHAAVSKWRAAMPPEEWKRLSVVVMGAQMPRKQNLAVQYFAKLLGEPGEGRRIVYAEALWDEAKALRLLATHRMDRRVAEVFFDNPDRMHRDLLADVAAEYLGELDLSK